MAINVTKQNGSLCLVYTHASVTCEVQDFILFLKWSNAYRYKVAYLKVEIQVFAGGSRSEALPGPHCLMYPEPIKHRRCRKWGGSGTLSLTFKLSLAHIRAAWGLF